MSSTTLSYPLCSHTETKTVDRRSRRDLAKLWQNLAKPIDESLLIRCGCDETIWLFQCAQCGFLFHDPRSAGDGGFYSALEGNTASYYVESRGEYRFTLELALRRKLKRVLDVGCGQGAFLTQAKIRKLQTHGMELNPSAAEKARSAGHTIYTSLLSPDFAQQHLHHFDLITAFQVLQHLPDAISFLRSAKELLRPNGIIIISVPNHSGLARVFCSDPHQWPPHHLTRWRKCDLRRLAQVAGLKCLKISGDRLYGDQIRDFMLLESRMREFIGKSKGIYRSFMAELCGWLFSKTGTKHAFPSSGLSMYAVYG